MIQDRIVGGWVGGWEGRWVAIHGEQSLGFTPKSLYQRCDSNWWSGFIKLMGGEREMDYISQKQTNCMQWELGWWWRPNQTDDEQTEWSVGV